MAQTKYPSTAYLNPDLQQSTAIPDAIGSAVKWLFPSDKKEELSELCEKFKIKKNSVNRIKNNGVIKIIFFTFTHFKH